MPTWKAIGSIAVVLTALGCAPGKQIRPPSLPTGVGLDAVGDRIELGSLPLNLVALADPDQAVAVLSGWREQGIQVLDLRTRRVTQTLPQDGAFYGAAFSPVTRHLYVSGGNTDLLFDYAATDGGVVLANKFVMATARAPDGTGASYPAGVAVSPDGRFIYVAENVANRLAVVDAASGEVRQRFATDHYPYAVVVAPDGAVWVSAWGGDTVSEFRESDGGSLAPVARIDVGHHPSALAADATHLYVALAGSDRIAVVDTSLQRVTGYLTDAAPGAPSEGSTPNALTLVDQGRHLLVAEGGNNAVAVFDVASQRLLGRFPTDWYPTAILARAGEVLIASGKGRGTRANPDGPVPLTHWPDGNPTAYTLGQLNGSLRAVPWPLAGAQLAELGERVASVNNWQPRAAPRRYPPFKHVVYVIKENRTYDQVLGDMKEGDGDPRLVFFPDVAVTPNHHALARRFGLFDRFFVNAEVSSQGHLWSMAAYVTDYGEKVIPSGYAEKRGDMDGEEAGEPERGFLWTLATRAGVSFRDYGEMVKPGWPVTQRDLGDNICREYVPFDLITPDQARADVWIAELERFVRDGNMPQLEVVWLPMDHLTAARPGKCTPRACMADNDLALGRMVQALSHSPYWKDTVVFVVEDDAQAGPDHVDSHRAPFFAISAFNRPGTVRRFVNTTDVVAAIEDILGLGQLSKFDYFSRSLEDVFAASPDLTPYEPVTPLQDLKERNPAKTAAAVMSEGLDLSAPDRADDALYNRVLWQMLKGDAPLPAVRNHAPLQALMQSSITRPDSSSGPVCAESP